MKPGNLTPEQHLHLARISTAMAVLFPPFTQTRGDDSMNIEPKPAADFPAPGIYLDLPAETYHDDRLAVSNSGLGLLRRSPAHFRHWELHGERTETAAMAAGRRLHSCVEWLLTSREPREEVAVFEGRRAGKAWIAFQEEAAAEGKEIWTATEFDAAMAMAEALVEGNPVMRAVAGHCLCEVSAVADFDGQLVKARADLLVTGGAYAGAILDLKTCTDGSPEGFLRAVDRHCYDRQSALYLEVFKRAGAAVDDFYLVSVEKDPPHVSQAYALDVDLLATGRRDFHGLLAKLRHCRDTGDWGGYCESDIETLEAPPWGRFAADPVTFGGLEVA